jgi:peptidoglycan hydrolase FlgJ
MGRIMEIKSDLKQLPGISDPRTITAGDRAMQGQEGLERERSLKKACADFESIFVYYMFKTMRQTVKAGGAIGQSPGKETFDMMMDQKVAEELTRRGDGLGLQKILFNQLRGSVQDRHQVEEVDRADLPK